MRTALSIGCIACFLVFVGCGSESGKRQVIEEVSLGDSENFPVPVKLSSWGIFGEPMCDLIPNPGVVPYELNTPLFSDYAQKARFVWLPADKAASYHESEVMEFPFGTLLIKNFYYPVDFRSPEAGKRIMETRLLVNDSGAWEAWTYVWNKAQTEAYLDVAGASVPVSWKDNKGVLRSIEYSVPNKVQCKGCHERSGKLTPIGPTARQLNREYAYDSETMNQLEKWHEQGMLNQLPKRTDWSKVPKWDEPVSGTLDQRARAWLEINCAHCHRRDGPAKNTGLYLMYSEKDPYRLGINKPPVAAGRGSGGLKYGIVPGKPDQSILIHRISSLDPGVMMPEMGRKLVHEEGVELIREWIRTMDTQ